MQCCQLAFVFDLSYLPQRMHSVLPKGGNEVSVSQRGKMNHYIGAAEQIHRNFFFSSFLFKLFVKCCEGLCCCYHAINYGSYPYYEAFNPGVSSYNELVLP